LPSEWKTHTLIWRNKADLEEHSLEDLFNSLKIYEAEVKHFSSIGNPTQNLAFVSSSNTDSTNDSVSAATSVFVVCAKLPVDGSKMADGHVNMRARRFLQKTGRNLGDNKGLKSVEARLVVYKQNKSILEENIKLLNMKVQARDTALVTLRQKLNQTEQERDDLKLKLDKFQTSSKNLTKLLASQTNEKHGLGYFSSKSDCESLSPSSPSDRLEPSDGYHAVPPPITGTFIPPKPDLVFHTAPIDVDTNHSAFTVQLSPSKPTQDLSHTNRPSAPIIKDWVYDSEDESETNDPQSVPSFVQSSEQVKTPRHSVQPCSLSLLDEYLPQWDDHLATQKQESELEWKNPFVEKNGEDHTILYLSKEEENNNDFPYPKFQNFKKVAAQIINQHEE
nr:hypothetical protein [Tanacetum cinerariifolium]